MKFDYDYETDSLYINFNQRKSVDSMEISDGVVVDFDEDGRVTGIDVEHASTKLDLEHLDTGELPLKTGRRPGNRKLAKT